MKRETPAWARIRLLNGESEVGFDDIFALKLYVDRLCAKERIRALAVAPADWPAWAKYCEERKVRKRKTRAKKLGSLASARATHDGDRDRTEKAVKDAVREQIAAETPAHRVRGLAAKQVGISRARVDQILGPVKAKTKVRI